MSILTCKDLVIYHSYPYKNNKENTLKIKDFNGLIRQLKSEGKSLPENQGRERDREGLTWRITAKVTILKAEATGSDRTLKHNLDKLLEAVYIVV